MTDLAQGQHAYRDFCGRQRGLPIFCQPWYLDAVVDGGAWDAVVLLDGGAPVAAWPYFYKRRWGLLHYVTMPHFTKHLGPLPADGRTLDAQQVARMAAGLPPFDGLDQQCSPLANAAIGGLPDTYATTPHYTHRIALAGTDWEAGINRNMRRNIRKAAAHLHLLPDVDLAAFFEIHQMSFARQELALPYSYAALERHDAALAAQGRRRIFAAADDAGRIHSVAYLIWDDGAAYYHLSGDDPALRSSGSGIWLIAAAIRYTQTELGLPIFDFEGSMLPAVAAIRDQFGAQRTTYYRIQMARSVLYRVLKWWRGFQ